MTSRIKLGALVGGALLSALAVAPANADKFKRPIAVFAGLDKITGRIISFEVALNETVQFGSLQITPRACFNRPLTEAPRTDAFAEVDEVEADKSLKHIFAGWMFADSPGLHGIEHPVYDIWLTECKGDGPLIKEAPETAEAPLDDPDARPPRAPTRRRRPRRRSRPKRAARGRNRRRPTRRNRPPMSAGHRARDGDSPGAPMRIGR